MDPYLAVADVGFDIGVGERAQYPTNPDLPLYNSVRTRLDVGDLIVGELDSESEEWIDANMGKLEKAFWSGVWRGIAQDDGGGG